ncbi:Peptidase inhibitor family I36 [Micromonospora mirobrigensis]|uniref:Peptidase inhibitor family I36 n=2 Tax=Micromonospora mirobrigensis TaxID=262898 RepID=A0A1C5AP29_9ACTN|nr:Peptidase inhibitor family I36 [Micromonospora mirobrigensis]
MSHLVKRLVAATSTGLLLGVAGLAAPAYAAGTCSSGKICMWEDFSYNGSKYVDYTPGSISNDKYEINGFNGDNEISSVINNTDKCAVLYDNDGFSGTRITIGKKTSVSNLRTFANFDNEAESFALVSC